MRSLVGFDVSKDRVLYRENAEGRIENVYSLKIMNKDQRDHTYVLEATGLPDLKLQGRREIKVGCRRHLQPAGRTVGGPGTTAVEHQRGEIHPQGCR